MADQDLVSATGLALAAITSLLERPEPVPRGEVARCLRLLAETASPDQPEQKAILASWAQVLDSVRDVRLN